MFIRFDVIHKRDGRTDIQTDGQTLHYSKDRACIATTFICHNNIKMRTVCKMLAGCQKGILAYRAGDP